MANRQSIAAALAILAACRHAAPEIPHPPPDSWIEPTTGMVFVLIKSGDFVMGSTAQEPGREPAELPHLVRVSKDFYLGRDEVTQRQWRRVMGGDPSHFTRCGADCPVEQVSWHQVREYLARLQRAGAAAGERFRLPTEAEWEYSCRAGTTTPFSTGANLTTLQANYDGNHPYDGFPTGIYREGPTPVGSFAPNAWGLRDMHGNVWEWCEDDFCPYPADAVTDPVGSCSSERKVIRGGSWYFDANSARCALRYTHQPADRGFSLGFRVVREVPPS
ncbi:MAG TPA: formylglycine-generating enzyme family protein [Patescibacteria group bacterium]|nr:formylglycine-generating enzyme family protein [Patescibacteria group bacterium]